MRTEGELNWHHRPKEKFETKKKTGFVVALTTLDKTF